MIYIALNVIFNAFLLGAVLRFSTNILQISPVGAWCVAYLITGSLTIIGYTKFATGFMGVFMPGRKLILREKERLDRLLQEVIDRTNAEYGTTYKLSEFKIRVTDNKMVNVCALGYNNITVNRGAFDAFTDEQLRAVLAHEMGHLYYRDSVKSIALIFSSFATRILMLVYGIYALFATTLSNNAKGDHGAVISLLSLLPLLFFLPLVLLNWAGAKIFTLLNMKMSRGAEYRADAFAASLGYNADMISALEVIDGITIHDDSFIAKIMSTHPATMLRIGALEDEVVAGQRLAGLFVATPFSTGNNAAVMNGRSDVMQLSVMLLMVGIVWCGISVFQNQYERPVVKSKPDANVAASKVVPPPVFTSTVVSKPKPKPSAALPGSTIVHVIRVTQDGQNTYGITYSLPGGGTNTIYKHDVPSSDRMTLDQLNKIP